MRRRGPATSAGCLPFPRLRAVIRDQLLAALRRGARRGRLPRAGRWRRAHAADRRRATAPTSPRTSRCSSPSRWGCRHATSPPSSSPRSRPSARRTSSGSRSPGPASSTSTSRPRGSTRSCAAVVAQGERYGHGQALAGDRINLEFVSLNPTGPIHAGGGRWVAVGDALANLLAAQGAEVHREYYLNDAGNQLDTFAASLVARFRGEEPPEDGYHGEYVVDMARQMREALGDRVDRRRRRASGATALRSKACATTSGASVWSSTRGSPSARCTRAARSPRCSTTSACAAPCSKPMVPHGCVPPTSVIQRDRVLVKSDGDPTYLLADLAYHRNKFERGWEPPHRHLGRRPPRAGEVAAGRDGGARVPGGGAGGAARPAREASSGAGRWCGCPGGPATSSRSPTSSTRSIPTSCASRSCCRASTPRRPSTSTSSPRSRWTTPCTTCSTRTRASRRSGARQPQRASSAFRSSTRISRRSPTSASSSCCVRSSSTPTCSRRRPRCAHRTASPRGCATSPRAFHGFYRDCRVISDDAALTQARLWLAEACRLGAGERARDPRCARARRDVARRRRTTVMPTPATPRRSPSPALGARRSTATGACRSAACDVADLAATFGTPLYVYDEGELRARCREYRDAFGDVDGKPRAPRTRGRRSCVWRWRGSSPRRGCDLDVATGGEAHVAQRAGFPPERIVFHGNNKSELELRARARARRRSHRRRRVRRARPHRGARGGWASATAGAGPGHARCRGAHPRVHRHGRRRLEVRLHGVERRGARRGDPRVEERAMDLVGFHCHIGSQILALDVVRAGGRGVADARRRGCRCHRFADRGAQPRRWPGRRLHGRRSRRRSRRSPTSPRSCGRRTRRRVPRPGSITCRGSTVEAGRSIAGPAGLTLYTVGTVKDDPRGAHVRGGRRRNERQPASGHVRRTRTRRSSRPGRERAAARRPPWRASTASRATSSCATRSLPDDIAVGDVLATPVTGAYAHSMASNYNLVPRPAVVFVGDDGGPRRGAPRDAARISCREMWSTPARLRRDAGAGAGRDARLRQRGRRTRAARPRPRRRDRGARRGAARGGPRRRSRPHEGPRAPAPVPLLHRRRRFGGR